MNIEVQGHSGCKIDVVNEENGIFVYKSTSDPKYKQRLALQAKKQMHAANALYQHIRVPKIYDIKEESNATTIKMQYVYSKNFVEFLEHAGFEQIDYLIVALQNFIDYEVSKSELNSVTPEVFLVKFNQIKEKLYHNTLYSDDGCSFNPKIERMMTYCQQLFNNLKEIHIPIGVCHGDLTLSNILFNGNNYYLIDFLDSFIETPLQDIVKIRQDTAYRWSQLMYTKHYDAVRLRIVCDKIDKEIHQYFSKKYKWYVDNYCVMQVMNILRILPYAKEEKVVDYLLDILNDLFYNEISYESNTNINKIDCKNSTERTVIVPIAANKPEYANSIPLAFRMAEDGTILCIKALLSLDLKQFDHVYITILRVLDERYSLSELLNLQLHIKGIRNAEVVVLEEPTSSQPETIYQTICNKNIHGEIFIKDADCSFCSGVVHGNAIVIYPLEELEWVNPQNKSYVNVDDMYYITNIIEKRIVSHNFTAGGYCFKDADTFCSYYRRYAHLKGLYLSHIIYSMLLDKCSFRPEIATVYEDFELKNCN